MNQESRRLGSALRQHFVHHPWLWMLLVGCLGGYYARFIVTVSWNAIELIIAQHLLEYGAYATSVDYPSALTWRPLVPTLLVTALRLFTDDPMRIYQVFCGLALATATGALFVGAKRLWGVWAAHTAAALAAACPAITTYLIDHAHSYSHLGMLWVLGPALCLALLTLAPQTVETGKSRRLYWISGVLWTLCYLSRAELMLFAGLHFLALSWLSWKKRLPLRHVAAAVVPFVACFVTYNVYAEYVATRDGILIRKTIYGMYISQGWVDPPPNVGADIEGEGYVYATQLYGDPVSNDESLVRAISSNVPAFVRRVKLNLVNLYALFAKPSFVPWYYSAGLLAALVAFLARLRSATLEEQMPIWFLLGTLAASHFVLMYHIDARYLTVAAPSMILIIAYGIHLIASPAPSVFAVAGGDRGKTLDTLNKAQNATKFIRPAARVAVAAGLTLLVARQISAVSNHRPPNTRSIPAMRALAQHFQASTARRTTTFNREPHIRLVLPDLIAPLYPEDQFLLAYFSRTAWYNGPAGGPFPRGKFYSYRDCPDDYVYLPADKATREQTRGLFLISECTIPDLGAYRLYRPR